MKRFLKDRRRLAIGYWAARIVLILFVAITFFPFILMLTMSSRENIDIQTNILGLPTKFKLENFTGAFPNVAGPIVTSLLIGLITVAIVIGLSALSGFAFSKMNFKGKEVFYLLFIGVMMIPSVLTVVPLYSTVVKLGLINSYLALILPYSAGLQLFGMMLMRSYISTLPDEMFEAARIEGAGDGYLFTRIVMPLAVPIAIAIGITSFIAIYNDYAWPILVLSGESMKTFCMSVVTLSTGYAMDLGLVAAGYVIGTIPMVVIVGSCMKYYIQGVVDGAVKG